MHRYCLPLVLVLLFPCGTHAEKESSEQSVARLAANLMSLTSCSEPERNLSFRVAVFEQGFEHVSSQVYLQWLEWDELGPRLVQSTLVSELSTGMWSVGQLTVIPGKRCAMQINAQHTYSSEAARFVLRPAGAGKYSIRKSAGNPHRK